MWVSPGALLEYPLEESFLLGLSRAFAVPSVPQCPQPMGHHCTVETPF